MAVSKSKTMIGRDGRADECDGLENRWVTSLVGSNPTPSARCRNHNVWAVQTHMAPPLAVPPVEDETWGGRPLTPENSLVP